MNSYLLSLLFILLIELSSSAQVIKLSSNVWPPFTNTKGQKAISRDVVREVLTRSGYQTDFSITEFSNVLSGLSNKTIDGSPALWHTEERAKELLYSDAYLTNKLILVGRKGSDVSFKSLGEVSGKRIAIVNEYAYGPEFETAKNVEFIRGTNDQQNLNWLIQDSVDYVLVEALLVQYLMIDQQEAVNKYLEIGKNSIINRTLHFAIRRDYPNSDTIIKNFNRNLKSLIADGIFNKILELNWVEVDVDNDGKTELVLILTSSGVHPPKDTYSVFEKNNSTPKVDQRYFIQGKYYDSWEEVPDSFKVDIPKSNSDLNPSLKIKL
jgi:ABC-type amino acid transport substrate-binding protein